MSALYMDSFQQIWMPEKLDDLLSDPEVSLTVQAGVSVGLRPNQSWCQGAVLAWARVRYRREAAASLLFLLVARYFDTVGAQYLARRSL